MGAKGGCGHIYNYVYEIVHGKYQATPKFGKY